MRLGVVGVNIGMNRDAADAAADYRRGLEAFATLADYVTVNVSSPNTPGCARCSSVTRSTALWRPWRRRAARRPLFLKVAPDLEPD